MTNRVPNNNHGIIATFAFVIVVLSNSANISMKKIKRKPDKKNH